MQIEAIYNQGRLDFISPVKLKNAPIRVKVDLPDEVVLSIETSTNKLESVTQSEVPGAKLLSEFRKIMGSMHRERPSASVEEDKDAYAEALGEKYEK